MKKMINYLNETIKKQKALLIFIIITFLAGLLFGSLFINLITDDDKKMLTNQIVNFFSSIRKLSGDVFGLSVFSGTTINNLIQLILIFIL